MQNSPKLCLWNEPVVWCPGCEMPHMIWVSKPNPNGAQWRWNQDPHKPTFSPSILLKLPGGYVCHSFLEDGVWRYLADCTHKLAGQTVPLPDLPRWVSD